MIKRLLLLSILVCVLVAGVVAFRAYRFTTSAPSNQHTERILQIPRGAAVVTIARLLEKEGLLTDARLFGYYVRLKKSAGRIKAGEFRFYTDLTPAGVLEVLTRGEEVHYKLTFPEGYNLRDMAKVVSTLDFLDGARFLAMAGDPAVAKAHGFETRTLEGFLFPSTYELTRSQNEKSLIDAMVRQFQAHWTPELEARAKSLHMTRLEVVTLASVIEKETGHPDERPLVGSVFHNRLKRGMKLESDPTIIYGLQNYDGDIRRADILRPHPWNTYVIRGLPPSPIANPGDGALRAALFPAETDFLYFVAKGDRTHTFSRTYAEHAQKVIEYQIRRREKRPASSTP